MFPQYFGPPDEALYGVYHMPESPGSDGAGLVLCAPVLHEGVDARRALRALAERLARAGHHVLRFDYRGTGDSAGDGTACDTAQWRADIGIAIDELKASRGLSQVGLVGLRFGATLAAEVATSRDDVPFLVLWEPIVEGRRYVESLRRLQAAWIDYETAQRPGARQLATDQEVIGLPFEPRLADSMARADLRQLDTLVPRHVLLVDEGLSDDLQDVADRLGGLGPAVETRHVDGGQVWRREIDGEWAPVPQQVLSTIVDWVGSVAS